MLQTRTENVSLNGFFCYANHLFPPGVRLRFLLKLSPSGGEPDASRPVYLDGVAEVVHVKIGACGPGFGLGCRVEGYRVLPQTEFTGVDEIASILSEPFRIRAAARLRAIPPSATLRTADNGPLFAPEGLSHR